MPSIEIITSITGGKDDLVEYQNKGGATFTCYSDVPLHSNTWQIKKAPDIFKDPRRNSRVPKIIPHLYSDADITIWQDGNMRLIISPEEMVERYLKDFDMAIYNHVNRDCIYDEAMVCAKLKLDDPEIIIEQAKYYEDHGFPKHRGLCEGGFIIRRNNKRTKAFNEAWWANYCRFSRRDQLSLMPALEQSGVNVNIIQEPFMLYPDGTYIREKGGLEIVAHSHFEGNFNGPQA